METGLYWLPIPLRLYILRLVATKGKYQAAAPHESKAYCSVGHLGYRMTSRSKYRRTCIGRLVLFISGIEVRLLNADGVANTTIVNFNVKSWSWLLSPESPSNVTSVVTSQ